MSDRLPPLNALRAFEAVARHLSLATAAAELHVTPGAISHQIRGLEDHLGVELFRRAGNRLHLSDAGRALLPEIQEGFARMRQAMRRLREADRDGPLVVSAPPSFAAKWLVPRLCRFQQAFPAIDINLIGSTARADLVRDQVDVAIRYGGHHSGLTAERLTGASFVAVCAPRLRTRSGAPIRGPGDLADCVLIHDDTAVGDRRLPGWRDWLDAVGVDGIDTARGPRFSSSLLALEAAACGKGVALVMDVIAEGDVASGRLVRLFDKVLAAEEAYYVVTATVPEPPKVASFKDWLRREAAAAPPAAGRSSAAE